MPTPHISAKPGDFASSVLMPGDPMRAKRIAEAIFDDARLVTDVRGMLGFTGTVQGQPLSVMGSGMGQPSASIYATELFQFYDVQRIIRVGTCGGIAEQVLVGDSVIATGAHTDSSINTRRIPGIHFAPIASFSLVSAAVSKASELGKDNVHVGPIISRDHFYLPHPSDLELLQQYGVLGVEMETAALYAIAAQFGREALTVLTVSDRLDGHGDDMSSKEREFGFFDALDLAIAAAFA